MRASLALVLAVAGCPAESPACPAGDLGCPCRPDRDCIAGLQCGDDGVCRDDEPLETETAIDPSTTIDDATATVDATTIVPTTTLPTTGPTDSGDATTFDPQCVCGWSDGQQFYTCGWDLPPEGPVGLGMPECPVDGLGQDVPCDAVDPPLTAYGCCLAGSILAFCHPRTLTIAIQECLVTDLGCAAVE